ncbi:methylmalonyl Co-A mutase-associated GTPase MeaB [Pontibacter sp. G13]|uniref:methylmalonyl Co-A mutase-associated GTPase MeaB n=1 Tax=Pontibacter sp. G13 TaxID=3074898 RepID=UPI0028890919|nr:methylmalonyl Co-A mutase-associated GTPase MeaB [Pontibacter sp. G13]WNJ18846.1 methylmalonyl Co-A mutase-associated GTPase MeaB [Pontibacter sp. G13]
MRRRRSRLTPEAYAAGILGGDLVMLSRAITLVESSLPSDRAIAGTLISQLMPHTGNSFRLGITGVPGVGKSTFIDSFGSHLTQKGLKVAVLAIDPTSQVSRGSILGDKTRMKHLSMNPQAFIRPSPAGDSLGGVTRKTREALLLCEAAGFDYVIVETVGVGQSETAVHGMIDFFLLLALPNAGDELQGIKKGIMEMADGMLINKSDGEMIPAARKAKVQFGQALRLFPLPESGWRPQVQLVSAINRDGLSETQEMIEQYREICKENGYWDQRRKSQSIQWMEDSIEDLLLRSFYGNSDIQSKMEAMKKAVLAQSQSPIQAAEKLVDDWLNLRKD